MSRRWLRLTLYVVLWIPIVLVVGFAILFAVSREAAVAVLFVAALLIHPLIANTRPPPIAAGLIATENWHHPGEISRKLTAVLEQAFPAGSGEAALKSALQRQGFKPVADSKTPMCAVGATPAGVEVFQPCAVADPSRVLLYKWSTFPCGSTITIRWTTRDNGAVARIDGQYDARCL
jgi:hypothetical protein